jgi:hypothetical protein
MAALSDGIQGYDEKIEKLAGEKCGHTALLRQGGADHSAGLRMDLGESRAIREESRCRTVSPPPTILPNRLFQNDRPNIPPTGFLSATCIHHKPLLLSIISKADSTRWFTPVHPCRGTITKKTH